MNIHVNGFKKQLSDVECIYIYLYFYNFYRCQKFPSSGGLGAFGGRSTAFGCAATDFVQDGATQADAEGGRGPSMSRNSNQIDSNSDNI